MTIEQKLSITSKRLCRKVQAVKESDVIAPIDTFTAGETLQSGWLVVIRNGLAYKSHSLFATHSSYDCLPTGVKGSFIKLDPQPESQP